MDGDCDLAFPEVDIVSSSGVSQSSIMRGFKQCKTRADYALTSTRRADCQFYGLFRRSSLIRIFPHFERTTKMRTYAGNYFTQVALTQLKAHYVPSAKKLYRLHGGNAGTTSPALYPFIDHMRYMRMCFEFWLREADVPLRIRARALGIHSLLQGRRAIVVTVRLLFNLIDRRLQRSPN